ncbi:MAG: WD40 repeat domain-containing protein [Gemmataceae bacterium]
MATFCWAEYRLRFLVIRITSSENVAAYLNGSKFQFTLNHYTSVDKIVFSNRGGLLATLSRGNKVVRLWDATTGEPVGEPLVHTHNTSLVAFSPDDTLLVTACAQHLLRFWGFDIPAQGSVSRLKCQAELQSGRRLMPSGRTQILDRNEVRKHRLQLETGQFSD